MFQARGWLGDGIGATAISLHQSAQQRGIPDLLSEAGMDTFPPPPASSWMLVGFVTPELPWELLSFLLIMPYFVSRVEGSACRLPLASRHLVHS